VLVVEKEPVFGGTTARSGGWMWIPNNPPAKRAGVQDSVESARRYIQSEAGGHFNAPRVDAFLEAGPKAIEFFEQSTALKFELSPAFADYHPKSPGGMDGGRSIYPQPFDGRLLGAEIGRLRWPLKEIHFFGMFWGSGKEFQHLVNVTRSPYSAMFIAWNFLKWLRDVSFHGRPMMLKNGNALIGRLAKSCFDRGVPIWTRSPVRVLLQNDKGDVVGALIDSPKGPLRVMARKGVVLAAGGFPRDIERRKQLFPHAPTGLEHVTPAPPGNTGDGLRLGESVGGSVDDTIAHTAAWAVISEPRWPDGTTGTFPHFVDRSKPGVIAVTRSGRRFCNEANSYHDFCQSMYRRCTEEKTEICAFFIADHKTFRRYGLGYARPAPLPYKSHVKSGYLLMGKSITELAGEIGADPVALQQTITQYNLHARLGEDPEFQKGSTAYNRSLGDLKHKPSPCVAPVERGPFYAVKVKIGDLGTFAGLRCNENAQVLGQGGRPISGLYAAGNDACSIFGGAYPGGGTTLGPAVTFGYIAARHMAGDEKPRNAKRAPAPIEEHVGGI
jgi:glycine/D-amino acid oxidase-like deaminating enzyme